ncbi:ABC transporter substrate-binding protein [Actinophytocola oryzae]|uniref:Carbohydrate ABC transporter substrate-binding protein (CUT1 family) n=1 Tax=Actinophytocola oryzae TaxID=502181 RepID=A0A4R7VQY0_9PSEU|nr:ABC transporter substrate-binding protein [Actinophytocola oryzae]TDV52166.1 carbohydrate ABC transporter substrate-binding protein (CUT1 family) [Actinophytocola oryzae]
MAPVSRRSVLHGLLATSVGGALGGCDALTGFATTGGSGTTFFSTQFTPVEEAERFRGILRSQVDGDVSYVTSDPGPFATQIRTQVDAGSVRASVLGGVHGDLAPLADGYLTDLTDLLDGLGDLGWPPEFLELARAGTSRTWYVPWAQASYVICARKETLEHLPSGADVNALTYDQFLDWVTAARRANGNRPVLALPGGPKGLLHRFTQGFLLPSFTGGQITTYRSRDAVEAWEYFRELWRNTVPTSTTYDFVQEPLAAGEATIGWDHVARLINAPAAEPDRWVMAPSPRGPKGLGYMVILTGMGIPRGAPEEDVARKVIAALSRPAAQLEVLTENAFFPTVRVDLPGDLTPAISMEADAIERQRTAPDALVALPPVGIGTREGEVTKVFKDTFQSIVLDGADVRNTLDAQSRVMNGLLTDIGVACWSPDPAGSPCEVA